MKARFVLLIICLLPVATPLWAQMEKAAKDRGWIDILPDEGFTKWTRVAIPPDKPLNPDSQWKVDRASRTLICEGNRGHEWLRYNREFGDAIFHVEWCFTKGEGLKGYNSGVFVRNDADGRVWLQAQVGAGNDGFLFGQTLLDGKLTAMKLEPKPKVNHIKPAGDWNTYDVRCLGPQVTLLVNGEESSEFAIPEVLKGYVGLEAEGFRIEFRNIKVKPLR